MTVMLAVYCTYMEHSAAQSQQQPDKGEYYLTRINLGAWIGRELRTNDGQSIPATEFLDVCAPAKIIFMGVDEREAAVAQLEQTAPGSPEALAARAKFETDLAALGVSIQSMMGNRLLPQVVVRPEV
jgi:hypothetical protein